MKTKILLISLMLLSLLVAGCISHPEVRCNYDGVCEDWETDNCPDCADVLGRGVQLPPTTTGNEIISER